MKSLKPYLLPALITITLFILFADIHFLPRSFRPPTEKIIIIDDPIFSQPSKLPFYIELKRFSDPSNFNSYTYPYYTQNDYYITPEWDRYYFRNQPYPCPCIIMKKAPEADPFLAHFQPNRSLLNPNTIITPITSQALPQFADTLNQSTTQTLATQLHRSLQHPLSLSP